MASYILSVMALALCSTWYSTRSGSLGRVAFMIGGIMTLLITSLYVNEITENVFAVTIYLTIISSCFIVRGIVSDTAYLRTIGLYIGAIALVKILFYDLWVGVDNLIIRVLALMISGGIMIGLSQLYGRRVNRSWSDEFSTENFTSVIGADEKEVPQEEVREDIQESAGNDDDMPFSEDIARVLRSIDIQTIEKVRLLDPQGIMVFESKRKGIVRIAQYIVRESGKSTYAPGELSSVFQQVYPHVQSALPAKDLEAILTSLQEWIARGGTIELSRKG